MSIFANTTDELTIALIGEKCIVQMTVKIYFSHASFFSGCVANLTENQVGFQMKEFQYQFRFYVEGNRNGCVAVPATREFKL